MKNPGPQSEDLRNDRTGCCFLANNLTQMRLSRSLFFARMEVQAEAARTSGDVAVQMLAVSKFRL